MTKCCINFGATYFHKEDALIISGNWHQLFAPATHINITFYWPTLFREDAYLSTNQYVFFQVFFNKPTSQPEVLGTPMQKPYTQDPYRWLTHFADPSKPESPPNLFFLGFISFILQSYARKSGNWGCRELQLPLSVLQLLRLQVKHWLPGAVTFEACLSWLLTTATTTTTIGNN